MHRTKSAFSYSIPVLLGYVPLGIAFGLLLASAGYPWPLATLMSLFMYAGAAQFIAVGLFTAGATLWEAVLITLAVNARHLAYGTAMLQRFTGRGWKKVYLVFSLTDETFALLSSLGPVENGEEEKERETFMLRVSSLNQLYWTSGATIGAVAGSLLPFKIEGLAYALTALFIILMIEQMFRLKRISPFLVAAFVSVAATWILPSRYALLAALGVSLIALGVMPGKSGASAKN
jgi:4-azaleucine resistance transporter AzlC